MQHFDEDSSGKGRRTLQPQVSDGADEGALPMAPTTSSKLEGASAESKYNFEGASPGPGGPAVPVASQQVLWADLAAVDTEQDSDYNSGKEHRRRMHRKRGSRRNNKLLFNEEGAVDAIVTSSGAADLGHIAQKEMRFVCAFSAAFGTADVARELSGALAWCPKPNLADRMGGQVSFFMKRYVKGAGEQRGGAEVGSKAVDMAASQQAGVAQGASAVVKGHGSCLDGPLSRDEILVALRCARLQGLDEDSVKSDILDEVPTLFLTAVRFAVQQGYSDLEVKEVMMAFAASLAGAVSSR